MPERMVVLAQSGKHAMAAARPRPALQTRQAPGGITSYVMLALAQRSPSREAGPSAHFVSGIGTRGSDVRQRLFKLPSKNKKWLFQHRVTTLQYSHISKIK